VAFTLDTYTEDWSEGAQQAADAITARSDRSETERRITRPTRSPISPARSYAAGGGFDSRQLHELALVVLLLR
jgi:hypothetical protein